MDHWPSKRLLLLRFSPSITRRHPHPGPPAWPEMPKRQRSSSPSRKPLDARTHEHTDTEQGCGQQQAADQLAHQDSGLRWGCNLGVRTQDELPGSQYFNGDMEEEGQLGKQHDRAVGRVRVG
ncbi:hypothetical protein EV126DRAFT_441556 [Verticillium dahliae]|nr:hypothetical protein EV126DRAFT_441556 [Verticillium dahliae]